MRETLIGLLLDRKYDDAVVQVRKSRRSVRALMGLLFHEEPVVRWRAVTLYGRLALADPELVKTQLFRLLYSLSEESSVVGWASAQAIGEIARVAPELAKEDVKPVIHFMDDDEVSLPANRNTVQLAGSIWTIGNLADTHPELTREMGPQLAAFIEDPDPEIRGLSIWACCRVGYAGAASRLEKILDDGSEIDIYFKDELKTFSIAYLARTALDRLSGTGSSCL